MCMLWLYVCALCSFSARVLFMSEGDLSSKSRSDMGITHQKVTNVASMGVLLTPRKLNFKCRHVNTEAQGCSVIVTIK